MIADILFILISVFVLALFISFEFAYQTASFLKYDKERAKKQIEWYIWNKLLKNTKQFPSVILIGKITSIVIFGLLILDVISNQYFAIFQMIVFIAFTVIFLIFIWVTFPASLNLFNHARILKYSAIPAFIVFLLFYPVAWIFIIISSGLLALFGMCSTEFNKSLLSTKISLDNFDTQKINKSEIDTELEHDIKLFQNALDFSKVKLRECTIPRNEIAAIELNSPIDKLKEKFIETGYSKILVYSESIDHIIGYAESSDLFQNPKNIAAMLKNLIIVPETMAANNLLNLFMKEHKSIALVVDEFGGTAGIVTIEDIMEEIFGEIEDEHDSSDFKEEKLSDSEYLFSGRLEIDYLNEKFNLSFPESEDYETIAGYILHHHEEIPNENDKIKINKFDFEILKMQNPKIELVKVKINR